MADGQLSAKALSAEEVAAREVLLYACWAGGGRRAADGVTGMTTGLLGAGASCPRARRTDRIPRHAHVA